jgi:MarR family transcriptional regulator for hemolysin
MSAEPIGLLIASARRRLKQVVLARAAGHQLAVQQFWFLVTLREHPGLSQADLAVRARTDAPTTSRVLAGLIRRRLVRTLADPDDRRRARLYLTSSGERLAAELSTAAQEIRAAVIAGMTEAELETLRRGLRRVIDNLAPLLERGVHGAAAPDRRRDKP